jgi:zinc and cadmium transporter
MQTLLWTFGAVAVVGSAGQAAAYALTRLRTHTPALLLTLVGLAAGAMAGEALLHAVPEAAEAWSGHDLRGMGLTLTGGFAAMMLAGALLRHRACCSPNGGSAPFTWTSLLADGVCNFADGVAIAASFLVSVPLGIAATVAILVHEVPQEIGQCAVLLRGGMRPGRALAWNAVTALTAAAGAGTVLLLPFATSDVQRFALPAVAGAFLHIAAADLLPELRRAGDALLRRRAGLGFAAGLALMAALLLFES